MSFARMRGQEQAVTFLKEMVRSKKMPTTFLFLGPEGVGKNLAALNFVKALHCLAPKEGDCCDACVHCVKIEKGISPDVHVVKPQGKSNTIGVPQVREIIREVYLKPLELSTRVFIVDHAEYCTQEAANAFLKVLEEPPLNTLFILIATDRQRIIHTVLSRCQIVRFGLIDRGTIKELLKDKFGVGEEKAEFLSQCAVGRPGLAVEFLKADVDKKEIFDLVRKDFSAQQYAFDLQHTERKTLLKNLEIIASWYRDMLLVKLGCSKDVLVNQEFYETLAAEARTRTDAHLLESMEQIFTTYHYLHSYVNQKLAMSMLAGELGK
jgi:DNA polymerase-3 subunit delta'